MTEINRQWCVGAPKEDRAGLSLVPGHFVRGEGRKPAAAEGDVVVRAFYFSPDPMNHAWIRGIPGKFEALPVGAVMRGGIAGRVVESRNPAWKVGDGVTGFLEWADYSVAPGGIDYMGVPLQRIPQGVDLASGLTALGMTGICAYLGFTEIGKPDPGDTVLVSGASGGIGSIAGQIARIAGAARVVGVAGGAEKCKLVLGLGFDDVIDYKAGNLAGQFADKLPGGINIFFDNVGGEILDAAFLHMAQRGRIVVCGGFSHYTDKPVPIHNHIQIAINSLTMAGFFYFDHVKKWPEARERLGRWLTAGKIRELLDIEAGFDAVPKAAIGQFAGGVKGRKLIRIAEDRA